MKEPFVSIVILNWNGANDTRACLESLISLEYKNYEILLVDNGSTDDSIKQLKKYERSKQITLIQNKENYGFAEGNNRVMRTIIKQGKNDYILLLNNDTVVQKDFLSILVEKAQTLDSVGAIASKNYYLKDPTTIRYAGANFHKRTGTTKHQRIGKKDDQTTGITRRTDYCVGSCVLYPVSVLKKVGVFRPEYFAYCEDIDLSLRMQQQGYNSYFCGESVIFHDVSATSNKLKSMQSFLLGRNKIWLIKKNFKRYIYIPFLLLYQAKIVSTLLKGKVIPYHFLRGTVHGIYKNH